MAKVQMRLSSMDTGSIYDGSSSKVREPIPKDFPEGMRVLVVDDDTICLRILERMLLECRYHVRTCTTATSALSILRESKVGFDVVISDVHMPDMDGFQLLELIGLEMDLPVIMMSADMRTSIVMQGIKHGACDYLIKPIRMEELKNIWQHVVRKKCQDNREAEHSDSFEDSDRDRRVTGDAENNSSGNDATDNAIKSQKKRSSSKEDDEGELDNSDSSKKPRVVWSVELHQQFVNAVNQLGIDKAVPKRILDLMNVPGLTRENVASHLQKFRLYLKRLSMARHLTGLSNSLSGAGSNARVPFLGSLDFPALTVTGQIPPQTLSSWQDELFGQPSNSFGMPAMDQPLLQQASMQGAKSVPVEQGIAFGQPLMRCPATVPRQFSQSNVAVRGLSSGFPAWSSSKVISASNLGGLSNTQNSNLQVPVLQHQQLHPVLSESHCAINVQPSCLVLPSQASNNFRERENPVLANRNSVVVPSQSSTSFESGNNPTPMNQNSIIVPPQSSTSVQADNNLGFTNQNSSLTSFQGGNNPGLINQNSIAVPSQPLTSIQAGSSPETFSHSSSYKKSSRIVDYNLLSSNSSNVQLGEAQVSDEVFKNVTMLNSYSIPKSISSSVSSCTDVGTGWWAQTLGGNIGPVNQSCLMPNLSNIHGAGAVSQILPDQGQGKNLDLPNLSNIHCGGTVSQILPDQGQGRSLGFIGKGTRIPSRFAVDDIESPTNGSSLNDNGEILNQGHLGFNGDL